MDFSKLSKEQKLDLIELLQAKKNRKIREGNHYIPNPGQLPVHLSEKKYRYVFSANAAGKTTLAVHEAVWMAEGYNPVTKKYSTVPARVVVILDHHKKVSEQWLPELRKWFNINEKNLHKDGHPYYTRITFLNGSEILFGFHEQPPLAWEGVELSGAIFDEPPPRSLYISIIRGGRTQGQQFRCLMVGTPISCSWLRVQIAEPWKRGELDEVDCFTNKMEVNKDNLQDGYMKSFSDMLTPEERKIRLEGQFYDLGSLALAPLFDRKKHLISARDFRARFDPTRHPCIVAIDPHGSKPHHAIILGADDDNNMYYITELKDKSVPREFARKLKKWYSDYRIVDIICDCAGNAEMTGGEGYKSFIQILKEEGVRARATTFKEKSDEEFIEKIRNILTIPVIPNNFGLRIPKLRIVEENPGIVRDIENVGWQKNREGELRDRLDISNQDFLACLKYALASGFSNMRGITRSNSYAKPGMYGVGKKVRKYI